MPYLELTLRCREAEQPRHEHALEDIGALAVTTLDADAETPDERAILEPGVGELPLWAEVAITALFPAEADPEALLAALEAFDDGLRLDTAETRIVEDQDWVRAWIDQFQPMAFGRRTWIVPWDHAVPAAAEAMGEAAAIVRLDPGLAFGSGTHPTTALCLDWLDGLDLAGREVLDFGCGSGILALAALKLGCARAVGVDNDPQALLATHDNAERNGVADRLTVFLPADEPAGATYPVVVANILASALDQLAPLLAARTAPGGVIALSGILHGQHEALLERYAEWFDDLEAVRREDWMRISGRRR
jgi:ribosomal protein L11 methyltransferase